ncbi:MAG: hypothetical protein ACK4SM_01785 [Aquificaceae bacterium]
MGLLAVLFGLTFLSYAQEKACKTNPLEDTKFLCNYGWTWPVCKKVVLHKLDRIRDCIEKSQDYKEGYACFEERSWIEKLLPQ